MLRRMKDARGRLLEGACPDQLSLPLDWGREPWDGYAPRYLTSVDNLLRFCEPATETLIITDPAQTTLFLKGNPYG